MLPSRFQAAVRRAVPQPGAPLPDAELLTRFLDGRDEAAFEALVDRHLPAVRAVCRALLRDPNDVDDAAQATFLVLVRRGTGLRDRAAVGGWLHRVAWRAANRLRAENAARARRLAAAPDPDAVPGRPAADPAADGSDVLYDEIARLPAVYRTAVLTCYAAGVPTGEAAARLGWPKGTLLTRLAWARKRLRARLAGRGVTPAAGGIAALLAGAAGRSASAGLAGRIAASGVLLAAREPVPGRLVSDRTSSLTEGVVRAMAWNKTGAAVGVGLVAVALLGLGLGRMSVSVAEAADGPDRGKPGFLTKPGGSRPAAKPTPRPDEDEDRAPAAEPAAKPDAPPAGPGTELLVRRPRGSFTREVPPYGRATLTFTEDRLQIVASISIDKLALTVTADADYTMNRESMVYGIITGVDVGSPLAGDEAAEVAVMAGAVNDLPIAFRVRVEDDSIVVKDLKVGPLGSPLLMELMGNNVTKETAVIWSAIGGKFKADPNPITAAAGGVPLPSRRKK